MCVAHEYLSKLNPTNHFKSLTTPLIKKIKNKN